MNEEGKDNKEGAATTTSRAYYIYIESCVFIVCTFSALPRDI